MGTKAMLLVLLPRAGNGDSSTALLNKPVVDGDIRHKVPHQGEADGYYYASQQVELPYGINLSHAEHRQADYDGPNGHQRTRAVPVDQRTDDRSDQGLDDPGKRVYSCDDAAVPAELVLEGPNEEPEHG